LLLLLLPRLLAGDQRDQGQPAGLLLLSSALLVLVLVLALLLLLLRQEEVKLLPGWLSCSS
jgi:hypothetical protein